MKSIIQTGFWSFSKGEEMINNAGDALQSRLSSIGIPDTVKNVTSKASDGLSSIGSSISGSLDKNVFQ